MDPFGFDILELSGKDGRVYDSHSPHRHTFFEVFLFMGGKGNHEIDFKRYPVESNAVHFVSPGQIHQLSLKNANGLVLCFSEEFVALKGKDDFIDNFPFFNSIDTAVMKLNKNQANEIFMLMMAMLRESKFLSHDQTNIVHAYLNIILLKLKTFFLQDKKHETVATLIKSRKMTAFKKMVNDNFLKHQPLTFYASALNLSPNYLNALCKKHDGKTAIRIIQERLLLESKRLLYGTEMDVKEISFCLNFEDVSYFNRVFKKLTDLTPVQYRELSRQNR